MILSSDEIKKLLDNGFCPLSDDKLLCVSGDYSLKRLIQSSAGEWFYYTYKKADFERVHPLGGKTNYGVTVWGNA